MPTLAEILAAILNILGIVQATKQVVDELANIPPELGNVARESAEFNIEDVVLSNSAILTNATYGLAAINTSVNLVPGIIQGVDLHTIYDVLQAINGIPPYTLPETPPSGYGNGLSGTINVAQLCQLD